MSPSTRHPGLGGVAARRGSAYIAVLGISMLVTTIGLGAMLAVRSQRRAADLQNDEGDARAAALAGIDMAARALATNVSWRSGLTNDQYSGSTALGRGSLNYKVVDEQDADLTDNALDPVRVYGKGRAGGATRVGSVVLSPTGPTIDALGIAAYSAGGITFSGTSYASGGPVGCAGGCTVSLLATFNGDVECGSMLSLLGTVNGSVDTGVAARAMPLPSLYGVYSGRGTVITFASISSGTISRKVISPASNPYGTASGAGIYVIDVPALSTLTISQSRLSATLVVNLGLSAAVTISGANAWDPPSAGMPTLIVRGAGLGSVNINGSISALSESSNSVNFNPATTPYFGNSNATSVDTYPSEVRGLIHVIGSAVSTNIASNAVIRGCCISEGSIGISGGAILIADPGLYTLPPYGYFTPTGLAVQASTWRREEDN